MSLWELHHNSVGGFLSGSDLEWYHDDMGDTEAAKTEYDLEFEPKGGFELQINHVTIYAGLGADQYQLDRENKKIIFNSQPDVGVPLHAYYEREV